MANLLGKSALALLAILAFRNRDRLGDWLKDGVTPQGQGVEGNALDQILHNIGLRNSGLKDLLGGLRQAGAGAQADSWVRQGPNEPVEPHQVEQAIDPDTLDQLSRQTGLSREELLRRLAQELPQAVDRMTPEGRVPEDHEAGAADQNRQEGSGSGGSKPGTIWTGSGSAST